MNPTIKNKLDTEYRGWWWQVFKQGPAGEISSA
jgi:hypothetical protein